MSAKVYFTDMRAGNDLSLLDKVERLFVRAGLQEIIAPEELVAIKLHFGERGNTGYVRPQFVRRIVDKVKELGGKPFLTDANTLYKGSRANAVDHLQTAVENGFAYAVMGAPLIIADGLSGKEYVNVQISRKHFNEVKIGASAYHADALIAVTHFKGHELVGFGGVLKNLGMGLGSRSGKLMMHSDVHPVVSADKCKGCAKCGRWCPAGAISVRQKVSVIEPGKCIGCGECTVTCPAGAIEIDWQSEPDRMQEKIVEYAEGAIKNKNGKYGFISFVTQVTPDCDCCGFSDAPLVRDIGILASRDPVALDQACVDLVNREKVLPGSRLAGKGDVGDKFLALYPGIDWRRQLDYAEEIGLGTRKYELISC
ncbi:DUF362 domain-containing protein [Pelotomaculum terephthalicicum JT]|uniref:DUF362 domain-containing protein n=1 Tax=Pelotomaculum TaxID=191373 RepID=UPI0009CF6F82|nr:MULTISPECIES: DUF362 domain-containing protein [Pelotomaculum]MCG9968016.1 DUF362 domain-containing protein [Pelotomaculum terephthalicicum JT]OPX88865.1 MAG: Anaerobic sulfite reductase subunit C [Pelotomaculum sp. PtaB.Bin117]